MKKKRYKMTFRPLKWLDGKEWAGHAVTQAGDLAEEAFVFWLSSITSISYDKAARVYRALGGGIVPRIESITHYSR